MFDRHVGIVYLRILEAKFKLNITGRADVDSVAAENALENIAAYVQLRYKSAATAVAPIVTATMVVPIVVDALLQVVVDILVYVHVGTRTEGRVTRHVLEIVGISVWVVIDYGANSRRVLQGKRTDKRST